MSCVGAALGPLDLQARCARIHGTLFYDNEDRRDHIPLLKREADSESGSVNQAQRDSFARIVNLSTHPRQWCCSTSRRSDCVYARL